MHFSLQGKKKTRKQKKRTKCLTECSFRMTWEQICNILKHTNAITYYICISQTPAMPMPMPHTHVLVFFLFFVCVSFDLFKYKMLNYNAINMRRPKNAKMLIKNYVPMPLTNHSYAMSCYTIDIKYCKVAGQTTMVAYSLAYATIQQKHTTNKR